MKFILLTILTFLFSDSSKNEDAQSKYFGGWPHNPNKDKIVANKLDFDCPNSIGCECNIGNDCINGNCIKTPRGSYCFPKEGDIFPNFTSLDQYEDIVEIHDFAQIVLSYVYYYSCIYFSKAMHRFD